MFLPRIALAASLLLLPAAAQARLQEHAPAQNASGPLARLLPLAQAGDAAAQYHVGMIYNNGLFGTASDPAVAFTWFKKSADGKDPLGAYKMGCYFAGQFPGVTPLDRKEALRHKLVAAEAGYGLAQMDVARAYLQDKDVPRAMKWLDAAAHQGVLQAAAVAYWIHDESRMIDRDPLKAYTYAQLAARLSEPVPGVKLQQVVEALGVEIGPAARAKADRRVAEWQIQATPLTLRAKRGVNEIATLVETSKK